MPRKSRQPESPAGLQEYTQPGEIPLQAPDYKLAKYEAQPLESSPRVTANLPSTMTERFEKNAQRVAQIKTARSFTGRIASGRGRTITADDSSFAIESTTPLTAGEIALAQRNGFDDFSENGTGQIMVADKGELRRANGDINHVALALTSKDAGRER